MDGRSNAVGDLGDRVGVDSTVQRNGRRLGGHGRVAVFRRPVITVEQNQETPVELGGKRTDGLCEHRWASLE